MRTRIPKYRLHKSWGLGVVTLGGKDVYLGKYGTPESQAEYRRVIAEWLACGRESAAQIASPSASTPASIAINELVLSYLRFAKTYYVKNGRPTGELDNIKHAVKQLVVTYGHTDVEDFGPLALKTVREAMIASGLCRGVINERVNRIRRAFKWGVENQLVSASVLHGLQAVAPLKRGRCEVREATPVVPVPDTIVDATVRAAPAQIAAMIELQRLTGMRPGEVVLVRTADLDTSGTIWSYVPCEHKTEHHGRKRVIYLGPQAQDVIRPHLKRDLDAFIFSPRSVADDRHSRQRQDRVTPMTPSQRARRPKANPKRSPGERYTTHAYTRAIAYACDKAFPHPLLATTRYAKLTPARRREVEEWRRKHRWSPNRLRHAAATQLRKQFGIEAARVVLGHSSAGVTEIYAEQDLAKAAEIMGRVPATTA